MSDCDIGVSVVGVLDFSVLAKRGISFVEEWDTVDAFGSAEHSIQVLFRFADIFR